MEDFRERYLVGNYSYLVYKMGFFTIVGIIIIIYNLVYVITLCFVDCDVRLALMEKLGKKLGTNLSHLNYFLSQCLLPLYKNISVLIYLLVF